MRPAGCGQCWCGTWRVYRPCWRRPRPAHRHRPRRRHPRRAPNRLSWRGVRNTRRCGPSAKVRSSSGRTASLDRGLTAGIQSGEGANGWQLILAGTRPAQGQTFGVGYRRSDLFNDALTARATARGTLSGAFLADGELQVNRLRRSADTFVNVYTKFERSPQMEFYGLGADSLKEDRTRYLLNTASVDVRAGYRFTRRAERRPRSWLRRRSHRFGQRRRHPVD